HVAVDPRRPLRGVPGSELRRRAAAAPHGRRGSPGPEVRRRVLRLQEVGPRPGPGTRPVLGRSAMDVSSLFSVAGKRVVVTGGASGIGTMIARGFLSGGAEVIIASRKEDSL